MRKYKIKKVISIKGFIAELGENFTEKMKKRLLDLEVRCVLTRKEDLYFLNLKHVEHTKYETNPGEDSTGINKEYSYGQFVICEGNLYFAEESEVNDITMQSPVVDEIYNALTSEVKFLESGISAKKIDDSNIDFLVDTLLAACPQITQAYYDIISKYCAVDGFKASRPKFQK